MGRGLDGFRYLFVGRLCSFEGPPPWRAASAPRAPAPPGLDMFRWLLRRGNTSSHSEQRS